jgi:hypothetical protein
LESNEHEPAIQQDRKTKTAARLPQAKEHSQEAQAKFGCFSERPRSDHGLMVNA